MDLFITPPDGAEGDPVNMIRVETFCRIELVLVFVFQSLSIEWTFPSRSASLKAYKAILNEYSSDIFNK